MNKLISRAKWIRNTGIALLIFCAITIVLAIILFLNSSNVEIYYAIVVLFAVVVIAFVILAIMEFIGAIYILATDWKLPSLNNDKILWGILALVILPTISLIIFGQKAVGELLNAQDNNSTPTQNAPIEQKPAKAEDDNW